MSTSAPRADPRNEQRLVEEQAALRRVETLVASGARSAEVFSAVAREIAQLMHLPAVAVFRSDSDGLMTVIAACSDRPHVFQPGTRWPVDGQTMVAQVQRTGRPARVEDYTDVPGALAARARESGLNATAGAPIIVNGSVWGAVGVASPDAPLPEEVEDRLAEFTELVATAIANTQAHEQLEQLAGEQAALRRVATLVAEGATPQRVFDAVRGEVARMFNTPVSMLMRYDDANGTATLVTTAEGFLGPVGRSWPVEGDSSATAQVCRTGLPARADYTRPTEGPIAAAARAEGGRSAVGVPVVVQGALWGVVTVGTRGAEPLPADVEGRLAKFTELLATAIARSEAHEQLAQLADEQAALRRVATLVAEGATPHRVFDAVRGEVARMFSAPLSGLLRYDGNGTVTQLAASEDYLGPIERSWTVEGDSAVARVCRTGLPARADYTRPTQGSIAATARSEGVLSAVGVPVVVDGSLWGVMAVGTREAEPLPLEMERRLADFTELVATAIANAESREARAVLTEEQAALRRVATLVAEGVPSDQLFAGVTKEVAHVFSDGDPKLVASVIRFDPGPEGVLVGASRAYEHEPIGSRWAPKELYVSTRVLRTGRPARVDEADLDAMGGPDAEALRVRGFFYQVGSPVVVEGNIWGAMCLNSNEALPPDTDQRLASFVELIATAIANAEGRSELAASRKRLVAASDEARRRIERDLHDGVQQELVSLSLELSRMEADPPAGDALKEQLASVSDDVGSILDSLVEIARGIHPAILAQGGLEAALNGLARRSAVPVEVDARIDGPLPDAVEVAAYYVASEALTNVAKHADASVVHVDVTTDDGTLTLVVRDDGIGGADLGRGSGLVGLRDRVEALGGTITIDSSAGKGTCVVVTLPIAAGPDQELVEEILGPPHELESRTSSA